MRVLAWTWLVFAVACVGALVLRLYRDAKDGNPVAAGLLVAAAIVAFGCLTALALDVVLS